MADVVTLERDYIRELLHYLHVNSRSIETLGKLSIYIGVGGHGS